MSKIVITEEETSAYNGNTWGDMAPSVGSRSTESFWQRYKGALGVVGAAIALIFVLFLFLKELVVKPPLEGEISIAQFSQLLESSVNNELRNPESPVRKWVMARHMTVVVKSAVVKKGTVQIVTLDGSRYVKDKGENVQEAHLVVVFTWDGFRDKNGTTEVEYCYDGLTKTWLAPRVIGTTATVDLSEEQKGEIVEVFKTGFKIGAFLGAVLFGN